MSEESNDEINVGNISHSQNIAIGRNAQVIVYPDYRPDAVYNLPPPNPHFVGRVDQLEMIAANFASAANPLVVTQAIAGLGGVGKTQLALAYAHRHKAAYDLIWQLPANEPAALDDALRRLGAALRLPVQTADAPTARQLVLSWLNGGHQRWLLLYDNVDQMTQRDLRPYLPGGGHVLITSRQPQWQQAAGTSPRCMAASRRRLAATAASAITSRRKSLPRQDRLATWSWAMKTHL